MQRRYEIVGNADVRVHMCVCVRARARERARARAMMLPGCARANAMVVCQFSASWNPSLAKSIMLWD